MARVHFVKAAAKDNPVAKKGESYYWWKPRYGSKRYSKTQPRPSQLTTSDFLSQQMELEERIGDMKADDYTTFEDLRSEVEEIVSEIQSLGEEQGDKLSNMPDSLQQGPTGELLEGRASSCEEWADELSGVDLDVDEPTEEEAKSALDLDEPTIDDVEDDDLDDGQTRKQRFEELRADYQQELADKLAELKAEYQDKLTEAINELQGCSYQGE